MMIRTMMTVCESRGRLLIMVEREVCEYGCSENVHVQLLDYCWLEGRILYE